MLWPKYFAAKNAIVALQLDQLELALPPEDLLCGFHVAVDWLYRAAHSGLLTEIEADRLLHSISMLPPSEAAV